MNYPDQEVITSMYTITLTEVEVPDGRPEGSVMTKYRAYLEEPDGGGVSVIGDTPRGAAVKVIARHEAVRNAEQLAKQGSSLILPQVAPPKQQALPNALVQAQNSVARWVHEHATETHENSPVAEVARKPVVVSRRVAVTKDDIIAMLNEIIAANKRVGAANPETVDIVYKGTTDDYPKSRRIQPMSIDRAGQGWDKVCVAYCFRAGSMRSFRIDRIERAEIEV
jgi:hypothetical protein